jgi:hypothetical protein
MNNLTAEEKIQKLKDKIADARDYISSDFCKTCSVMYKNIENWTKELRELENERTG